MIRGKYLNSRDDIGTVLAIRAQVAKAQGLPSGRDGRDEMAVYALVFDEGGAPAGSGRLYLSDDRFMIDCVGVLPDKRKRGLGDLLMRMLLFRAQELGAPEVYALAGPDAAGFCARYGFSAAGEEIDERGAVRPLMRVAADDIAKGGCQGHGA